MKTKKKSPAHDNAYILIMIFSAFLLFLIILLGSFNYFIYNKSRYYSQYETNGVYAKVSSNESYAKEYVKDVTENMLKFFDGKEELKYFTEQEQSHMKDVKLIFNAAKKTYYASLILFIILFALMYYIYYHSRHEQMLFIKYIAETTFWGGIITLMITISMLLMSTIYFDSIFKLMHQALFPQGNWMFAESSLLIILFPEKFFLKTALAIFAYTIIQAAIFFALGIWLKKHSGISTIHKEEVKKK